MRRLKQNETKAMKKQANQLLNQNVKDTKEFKIPCSKSNYYTTTLSAFEKSGHLELNVRHLEET